MGIDLDNTHLLNHITLKLHICPLWDLNLQPLTEGHLFKILIPLSQGLSRFWVYGPFLSDLCCYEMWCLIIWWCTRVFTLFFGKKMYLLGGAPNFFLGARNKSFEVVIKSVILSIESIYNAIIFQKPKLMRIIFFMLLSPIYLFVFQVDDMLISKVVKNVRH